MVLLLIYCERFAWASVQPIQSEPFWKVRPELFAQVEKQRAIMVSAKFSEKEKLWVFLGGGHIKADLEESWKVVRQYEMLSRLTWVFSKVQYDTKLQELFLMLKFLGFERSLVVKIYEIKDKNKGTLQFQIIKGFFQGLTGQMGFSSYSQMVTEASVSAKYAGEVPFPGWIFAPGAEAVMHYVASELREIVEQSLSARKSKQ